MPLKAWCSALHSAQRSSDGTHQLLTALLRLLLRRSYDGTVKTPRCQHIWLPLELSSQRNHVRTRLLLINLDNDQNPNRAVSADWVFDSDSWCDGGDAETWTVPL